MSLKKSNSELKYSRKYLKAERKNKAKKIKGSFQCFYAPIILIDSIYRKDGNY